MSSHLKMARCASIGSWLIRLITWDGVLPAAIWSVPLLLVWLIPNNRAAIEIAAVVLPIGGVLVRYHLGKQHITSNDCSARVRRVQLTVFCVGIFVLFMIDAVIVLSHVMPKQAVFATTADLIVCAVLYMTYLNAMAFAMYPGVSPTDHLGPANQ